MNYISKEKLEQIKKEIEFLKTETRKEIAKRLEEAKKLGDLSENSEYLAAKEAQERNESKIVELDNIIRNALIIKKSTTPGFVDLNSIVKVSSNSKQEIFKIVGPQEANPAKGEISNESPIGRALLNRKVGDTFEINTPGGTRKFKIIEIK